MSEGAIVCIGEALVDLICPDPVAGLEESTRFEPHFGGALANVAVASARAGAATELAGGCGNDERGTFLRRRLEAERVGLSHYAVLEELETPYAYATLGEEREPTFEIHGDGIEEGISTLHGAEEDLVAGAGAVVLGSNTLPDEGSRAVTFAVRNAADTAGVPLLFDPNLRPGRWEGRLEEARELCLGLASSATLLKLNLDEASWLLGTEGSEADVCAEELARLGPRLVVVTSGPGRVVTRGACEADIDPPEVEMVSPLGAGDVFMGTLAAGLWERGWELGEAGPVLERAAAAGAAACSHLGAFD